MRKGFIFSLDALFAVAIILIAVGVLFIDLSGLESEAAFKQIKAKATDSAQVGFYTGKSSSSNDCFGQKYCYCQNYFTLNIDNNYKTSLVSQKFCEGYG